MKIIFLEPVFKEMIWGGNKLKTEFGYDIPSEKTGEAWVISAHPNGDCSVKSGELKGCTLSWLWENRRDLFGDIKGDVFPLLTKIIDAKDDLSVQVHPDDEYAKKNEQGSLGKTECWYVLDCKEDGELIIGHNAKNKDELNLMIEDGRWDDLLRKMPIKKGDFIQIFPGTIHAITKGTLILEIQQNSDITYRLYDYDRLSDGKKRPLHIDKSKDVIKVPYETYVNQKKEVKEKNSFFEQLIDCDYYRVAKADIDGREVIKRDSAFMLVSVIEGCGKIGDISIKKGDNFILTSKFDEEIIEGNMKIIVSSTHN